MCTHAERARTSNVHASGADSQSRIPRAKKERCCQLPRPRSELRCICAAAHPAPTSVARTQRAGPNAITCPSAAPPPLRCGRGPLSSTRCSHRMCQNRRRAHGRSNCTNSTGSVPGPFCARAGSAPALARAWTAPCRCRPARGAGRARQRGRVVRQAQTPASAQPRQHIHRSRAQRLEQLAEAVLHSMRRSRRFG